MVAFAAVVGITAGLTYKGSLYRTHGMRHITMDHIFNGTFTPNDQDIGWVPEGVSVQILKRIITEQRCRECKAGDGVFATSQAGFIQLVDLARNSTRILVSEADVKDVRF
jgi:dipeptidyl aminopeptidase